MTTAAHKSSDVTTWSFSFHELIIEPDDILSILGYAPAEAPAHVRDELGCILETAENYCNIRGGVRLFDDLKITEQQHLLLQNVNFFAGKIICRQLRGADAAALFAGTLGSGLEKWSRKLMADGDFLKGYIVDAVASVAVEAATEQLHDRLPKLVPGKQSSNRYSPGYCGWDVAEQQKLFSLLPPNFCGISLSASSLMTPIKSVSGLIGLGPTVKKVDYTCQLCDMQDCVYQRRREKTLQD